jgi:hypothetical protein
MCQMNRWHRRGDPPPTDALILISVQTTTMQRFTSNPYEQQILAKGRDLPAPQKFDGKVPARFADRFATYAEYQEAMADFLNGL